MLAEHIMPALSVLGVQGTLAGHRVKLPSGVVVYGKTGSMHGVSAVSGVVSVQGHLKWVYTLLLEGGLHEHAVRMRVMDRWFARLAQAAILSA